MIKRKTIKNKLRTRKNAELKLMQFFITTWLKFEIWHEFFNFFCFGLSILEKLKLKIFYLFDVEFAFNKL